MDDTRIHNTNVIILLATYNGERYLAEQLNSLQAQTYQDFHCLLHDDGSTDRTQEIIRNFCERDPVHFSVVDGPRCGGAKENFMFMLKNAPDAPYYMFCDQDDVWHENKIELTLNAMMEAEDETIPVCIHTDVCVVDENLRALASSYYEYVRTTPKRKTLWSLIQSNVVIGCTAMFNRILKEKACLLEDYTLIMMHDWWVAVIAKSCGRLVFIDLPLVKYRQHGGNTIGAKKSLGIKKPFVRAFAYLSHPFYEIEKSCQVERNQRKLAKALLPLLKQDNTNYEFIQQLTLVSSKSKFSRIQFYVRRGLIPGKWFWKILWV